jgi:hypothetical protein
MTTPAAPPTPTPSPPAAPATPPAAPPDPAAPSAPGQSGTPKPTTQRRPKINRETVIVIALVVATAELALVAALGTWTRWLIIHGAIAVIFLTVFLAKFGRTRRHRTRMGTAIGTGRGRGLGGLLGGRGHGAGSRGTGGHGTGAGHGIGGGRRGLGGILGGRGHGAGSRGTGLGGLFGGTGGGRGAGAGGGRGRGTNGHRGGLGDLIGGRERGKDHHGRDHGKDKRDPDRPGFFTRTGEELKKGWDAAGPKSKEDPTADEPESDEPESDDDNTQPAGQETPDTPATPQGGSTQMVKTHGTPSLQAWGRCLPSVEAALLEKQRELRRVEADLENIALAVIRLHNQGEQELPASPKIVALLADVQASLGKLPRVSDAIGRIASNANALAPLYRTEHIGDEDRLAGMRGGVQKEKRSDVGEAQKDT